jgi:hypothetical protein
MEKGEKGEKEILCGGKIRSWGRKIGDKKCQKEKSVAFCPILAFAV